MQYTGQAPMFLANAHPGQQDFRTGPDASQEMNPNNLASTFGRMGLGGHDVGQQDHPSRSFDPSGRSMEQGEMGHGGGAMGRGPMGGIDEPRIDFLGPPSGLQYAGQPSPSQPFIPYGHNFLPDGRGSSYPSNTSSDGDRRTQQPNPAAPPFMTNYGGMNQFNPAAQSDTTLFGGMRNPAFVGPMSPPVQRGTGPGGMRPASMVEIGGMPGMGARGMQISSGLDANAASWMDNALPNISASATLAQQMDGFSPSTFAGPSPHQSSFSPKRSSGDFRSPATSFTPSTAFSLGRDENPDPAQYRHEYQEPAHSNQFPRQGQRENTADGNPYGPISDVNSRPVAGRQNNMAQLPSTNSLSSLESGQSISSMAAGRMIGGLLDDEVIPTAIVIKNIPFAVQKETLLAIMESLGAPLPYAFNYHLDGGTFRGLAFANFRHSHEAEAVVIALNGYDISGRKLRVEYKKVLQAGEKERIERDKAVKRMKSLNFERDGQVSGTGGRERTLLSRDRRIRPQQDDERPGPRIGGGGSYQQSPGGGRSVSSRWAGDGPERSRQNSNQTIPPVPQLPLLPPLPLASSLATLQALHNLPDLGLFQSTKLPMTMPGLQQPFGDLATYTGVPTFNPMLSPGSGLISPSMASNDGSPLLQMPMGNLPFPLSVTNVPRLAMSLAPPLNLSRGQRLSAQSAFGGQDTQRGPSSPRSSTPGSVSESNDPNPVHRRISTTLSSHSSLSSGATVSLPLDLNDPKVLDIYSRILLFKEDRMRDELAFSRSLSIKERRLVHLVAQKLGMHHYSAGEGNDRYAVVTRMAPGGHQQRPSRTEQNLANFSSSQPYSYGGGQETGSDTASSPHLRYKKSMPNMNYLSGPSVTQRSSRLQPQRSSGNLRDYTTISNGTTGSSGNGGTIKRNGAGGEGSNATQMFNNLFGSSLTSPIVAPTAGNGGAGAPTLGSSYGSNGLLTPLDGAGFAYQQYQASPGSRSSPVDSSAPPSPVGGVPIAGVLRQPRGPTGESRGFSHRAPSRPAGTTSAGTGDVGTNVGNTPISGFLSGSNGNQRGRSDVSSLNTSGSSTIEEGDENVDDEDLTHGSD